MTVLMRKAAALAAAFCMTLPASAGVYLGQTSRPIHPGYAYQGIGGRVDIPLCPSEDLHIAARNVAAKFNRRSEGINNIARPGDIEYPPDGFFSVEDVLMHEVGHAIGLDHPAAELSIGGGPAASQGIAPANRGPNGVFEAAPGADGIFGTEDDERGDDENRTPFPLSADNSPFSVPAVVDDLSMSTDLSLRGRPGTWPLVPWAPVSLNLGLPATQSVMMTYASEVITRPSPDELTLMKWAESGADGVASTDDDYQLFLYVVPPGDVRPPNCIAIGMAPLQAGRLGEARFNVPFLGVAISQCFGNARCVVSSTLFLNSSFAWFYPSSDTSNGEADFLPLQQSDVQFTAPTQIEVNQGIPKTFEARIARDGSAPFPLGTNLTVTATNGSGLCVQKAPVAPNNRTCLTQFDLAGDVESAFRISVDGDATPSSGALFLNVFVPNREVARGRVTVVDRAEALVMRFDPPVVQVPTTGYTANANEIRRQIDLVFQTSQSKTPLVGAPVRGLVQRVGCTSANDNTVLISGPLIVEDNTDSQGGAAAEVLFFLPPSTPEAKHQSECQFAYLLQDGLTTLQTVIGFTTDQLLAEITPDRNQVVLRSVANNQQVSFVFDTLDQLGAPMAAGVELGASCEAPEGNQVQFAPVGTVTTDANGQATLVVEASTQAGSGFTEEVICTVSADGVSRSVTVAPVLPATLDVVPTSDYLMAPQIVVGHEVTMTVMVRDSLGDLMPGVAVSLSCPTTVDGNATVFQPVMPATRTTDNAGQVTLSAAIIHVGRRGLGSPVDCTLSAGGLSAAFRIAGQDFLLFGHGFENASAARH